MLLLDLLAARCPHCRNVSVFRNGKLLGLKLADMHHHCPECGFNIQKEPGYYWGAMYVSYGLGILEMLMTYFLGCALGIPEKDYLHLASMIATVLLLSPFNFRFSRVVWLYLVP